MTAPLEFRSALTLPLTECSAAFAQAFEGYFMSVVDDPQVFATRVRTEQVDLASSFVAYVQGEVAGVCLIARRGEVSRVAGMGITVPWRGKGVSHAIMERLLADARARGDSRVLLEVITQNVAAVRLYEKFGFVKTRQLVGYEASSMPGKLADLREIAVSDVVAAIGRAGDTDLPWQFQAATLAAVTRPTRAFRAGRACGLVMVQPEVMVLRALIVPLEAGRQGEGTRLLQALAQEFPGRRLVVPAIVPEALADDFMLKNGFQHSELSQWEMACSLE